MEFLVKEFPNLDAADEREALDVMLKFAFSTAHARPKAGARWTRPSGRSRSTSMPSSDQFSKRMPKLEEVMTLDILKTTADSRPKIG